MAQEKLNKLISVLQEIAQDGKLALAFSGGVDSSILLEVMKRAGLDVLTLTFDLSEALLIPEVSNNDKLRCYYCKSKMMSTLKDKAASAGYSVLCDGTNADDLLEYRPGLRALSENGVLSPIAMAGLSKNDLREIGRFLGLDAADKPSSPCGLTRFPYGTHVTSEMLTAVADAESYLSENGYPFCRVRIYSTTAMVEIKKELIPSANINLDKIKDILSPIGVVDVSIDPKGLRSGTMDEGENNG